MSNDVGMGQTGMPNQANGSLPGVPADYLGPSAALCLCPCSHMSWPLNTCNASACLGNCWPLTGLASDCLHLMPTSCL